MGVKCIKLESVLTSSSPLLKREHMFGHRWENA